MRRSVRVVAAAVLFTACWPAVSSAEPEFTFGHIYLSIIDLEGCGMGYIDKLLDIDPGTGEFTIFADSESTPVCYPTGLAFTPDWKDLLSTNESNDDTGYVLSFGPDGAWSILYDQDDVVSLPYGSNCLAFDEAGWLYLLNIGTNSIILDFPDGVLRGGTMGACFPCHSRVSSHLTGSRDG